jgi:hypothetical protein
MFFYVISFDHVLAAMLVYNEYSYLVSMSFASTMRTSHVLRYVFHISGSLRTKNGRNNIGFFL